MIEIVERENAIKVYFNFDPKQGCCCEEAAEGCGDIVYYFSRRELADGFAARLMSGAMEPLLKHWRFECRCWDGTDDPECISTELRNTYQVWP